MLDWLSAISLKTVSTSSCSSLRIADETVPEKIEAVVFLTVQCEKCFRWLKIYKEKTIVSIDYREEGMMQEWHCQFFLLEIGRKNTN